MSEREQKDFEVWVCDWLGGTLEVLIYNKRLFFMTLAEAIRCDVRTAVPVVDPKDYIGTIPEKWRTK